MKIFIICYDRELTSYLCQNFGIEYSNNFGLIYDPSTKSVTNNRYEFVYIEAKKEIRELHNLVGDRDKLREIREIINNLPPSDNLFFINNMEEARKLYTKINGTKKKFDIDNLNIEII